MKLNETHVRFLALLWVILYGTSPLNAQTSITRQPNIIFIMSDDHACKAISSYDSTLCMTPQIDRLSKNGIRFTNCFCTNAVCGPSRACILTGNLTHINGMINNDVIFDSSQVTLPKILKTAGYQTAIVGKWHLKSTPSGFDFWKILPGQGEYYNPDFITNGIQKRETGYVTNLIASSAMEWMEHRDQSKPFFLMINNKAPHKPWLPEMKYAMLYDTANIPVPENFFDNYRDRKSTRLNSSHRT